MSVQNYSNHRKFVTGFHFIGYFLLLALFVLSILNFLDTIDKNSDQLQGIIFILITVILILCFYYIRSFALKAQDRTIVLEENIRNYLRTGSFLPKELTKSQIISLRFASDEEYDVLSELAIKEKLKSDEIKQKIKNWKEDNLRL